MRFSIHFHLNFQSFFIETFILETDIKFILPVFVFERVDYSDVTHWLIIFFSTLKDIAGRLARWR